MAYKLLICDKLPDYAKGRFEALGLEVTVKTGMTPEELEATIPPYHVVLVRSATKVRKQHIDAGTNLKLIVRGGVGIDNIDAEYARGKGIKVMNTPTATSNSVAELALGLMLDLARHISRGTMSMKNGEWLKKQLSGREIAGKTLGLIGAGRIGVCLAEKCIALGMKVVAHDLFIKDAPIKGITMVDLDTLLAQSDYISLHIPLDKAKGATLGAAEFKKMKKGAYLVNCARGGTVDEDAMLAALNDGTLAGAGLDVFVGEPDYRKDVVAHPNVICTPHIGASTAEGQDRVVDEAEKIFKAELR